MLQFSQVWNVRDHLSAFFDYWLDLDMEKFGINATLCLCGEFVLENGNCLELCFLPNTSLSKFYQTSYRLIIIQELNDVT